MINNRSNFTSLETILNEGGEIDCNFTNLAKVLDKAGYTGNDLNGDNDSRIFTNLKILLDKIGYTGNEDFE